MKHKILLATDTKADINYLLEDLFRLLNKSHQKYVSAYSPFNTQPDRLAVASSGQLEKRNQGLALQLVQVDDQLRLTEKAKNYNFEFDLISDLKNFSQLRRLSKICDLLVWDQSALKETDVAVLLETLDAVECSVLLLPENWTVKSLVLPYDNSMNTIRMVKSFLSLFNLDLRKQPLSVLVNYPEDTGQIESEKVFIDYLKLFFEDMGIQLMPDNKTSCLENRPAWDCHDPFFLVGKNNADKKELLTNRGQGRPVFIFNG